MSNQKDDKPKPLWNRFLDRYPHADLSKFRHGVDDYDKEPYVRFVGRDGSEYEVFDKSKFMYSLYFPDDMKKALGLPVDFPLELTLNPKPSLPIPAIDFGENLTRYRSQSGEPNLWEKLKRLDIYATPTDYFSIPVRDIFANTTVKHTSGKESHEWLAGPNMRYWPQQLNFAVWCATTGCGVSQRLLFDDDSDSELKLPPQIRAILRFHVYFTIRRILFQMGGIQGTIALPGDSPFNEKDNRYDTPSYKRICKEFNVSTNSDFRCHKGVNHGLGSVYIWYTNLGPHKTDSSYPGFNKFSDEGGEGSKGNLLQFIINDESSDGYEYFLTRVSNGLTNAGQARLNQSIEALVYCVLGAQVNVRSSILGETGSAQEVRQEFLVLLDAIKQPDISKSVQRFQLAVQEAKVKLDLAVSPGTWLMLSRMVINTESTIGYNNRLRRVEPNMKLGVNTDVNSKSVPVGIKHNLGKSKVLLPHVVVKRVERPKVEVVESKVTPKEVKPETSKHEINLAVITVVVGGLAWFMFR